MAEQEKVADQFHTLMAVDLDVVHMAAFPPEDLNVGSVFHAWAPLRTLSNQVRRATRQADTAGRLQGIVQIFAMDAARIPLLTTIALAEYIFRWRAPDDGFKSYAILPPHEVEWNLICRQGRDIAQRWHENLPNRVRPDDIRRIIGDETDMSQVAGRLLDQMPETLSVLFPAQLRADYADRTLHEMDIAGVVAMLDRFPHGLPKFELVLESSEAKFIEDKIFDHLFQDAMRSPALQSLSQDRQARIVETLKKALHRDARVLTWLQQINLNPGKQFTLELDGKSKKLRAILITASARVWRAARTFGLAEACLRSPIAYLGEGRFFDWAFKDLIGDENQLLATLRHGKLSQWLEPLVSSPVRTPINEKPASVDQTYLSCVHEWERLMSHLATSLNLSSPTSGLQRAIATSTNRPDGRELVDEVTALLSQKIVDVTLRLSQKANVTGLRDPTAGNVLSRNLPPVMLEPYSGAEAVLAMIRNNNLVDEKTRNEVIERIVGLKTKVPSGQDAHIAQDYLQTVLMSLLWMRLGQWSKARDVVRSAVGFARSIEEKPATVSIEVVPGDIRGDEALYLLAVTGRLAAKESEDLVDAHAALRLAEHLSTDGKEDLRFQAEEQSRGIAEMLFSESAESSSGPLGALRLDLILHLFDSERWQAMRIAWQEIQAPEQLKAPVAGKLYSDSYVLQQMYCAVLMRYMLAYAPLHGGVDGKGTQHRVSVGRIFAEFARFGNLCGSGNMSCVADSSTSTQVRAAYLCWLDPVHRSDEAGTLLREQFRQTLEQEGGSIASGLDRRRTDWLYRRLAKGWII